MIAKTPPTLKSYYKDWFAPRALAWKLQKSGKDYLTAVHRFNRCLGREAMLSDLTRETLVEFQRWMIEHDHTTKAAAQSCTRLRTIWRFAYKHGATSNPPARGRLLRRGAEPWESEQPGERSLRWFFREYYLPLKLRTRAANTRRLYDYSVRNFGRFLGREPTLDDLTDVNVSKLMADMIEKGRSPYTVEKERCQLLAIWRYASRKNFLKEWPDVESETRPVLIPCAWTRDELEVLWAAIASTRGTIAGIPAADWWAALHYVLWFSAERISAVLALRWQDFDPSTGWLMARASTRKGKGRDQMTKLPAVAIEAIEKIRQPKRELIFPWDRTPMYLWRQYRNLLTRAGFPVDKGKSAFHKMRKSAASHFEERGGNATALLGHSSRKVTERYLDPRIVRTPQAAELLFTPGETGGAA